MRFKAHIPTRMDDVTMIDVYESAVEENGQFGAAFERNDDTAYFYLLDLWKNEARQIVAAFSVYEVNSMPVDVPISIRWHDLASAVGLFVDGNLLALFDLRRLEPIGRYADAADVSLFQAH